MPETRPCYIVDIDGTCADIRHRVRHIECTPKNHEAFYAAIEDDEPIEHMRRVVASLAYGAEVVFMSGRPERTRDATIRWLNKHGFNLLGVYRELRLYMRQDGDRRPDHQVKSELLSAVIFDGFEPIMAFDDRDSVVAMWRANGIPCAQVAPGDF